MQRYKNDLLPTCRVLFALEKISQKVLGDLEETSGREGKVRVSGQRKDREESRHCLEFAPAVK